MNTKLLRLPLVLLLLILPVAAQQNFKIANIEFEGLKRLSPDDMIATTGLKVGDSFSLSALDAAAQRLIDSGNFKNVAYRTRPNKDQISITFQVEEVIGASSRVVFDNFIWFTDAELMGAVKRDLPSFNGTAPDSGDTIDRINRALRTFLHEHQIEATVTHMVSQDRPGSPIQEHVFSISGVPMPICTIHFPGSANISEDKLRDRSKELKASEYSRVFVSLFTENNLIPLYREVGQLKAAFSPPLAKPEDTANCKNGVELTIPVDEGLIYKWNKAEWTGNQAIPAPELDGLLGMRAGQPANGVKVDQAFRDIRKLYGRKGFLALKMNSVPEFDEQAQNVVYRMDVVEGPQFRMGRLSTRGFSESETNKINEKWELKTGEIFDASYWEEFWEKNVGEVLRAQFIRRRAQNKPPPSVNAKPTVDRKALTVDITIELTN
jgi:outer membrane protein insertion porin family